MGKPCAGKFGGAETFVADQLSVAGPAADKDPKLKGTEDLFAVQGSHTASFGLGGGDIGNIDVHRQLRRVLFQRVGTMTGDDRQCRQEHYRHT